MAAVSGQRRNREQRRNGTAGERRGVAGEREMLPLGMQTLRTVSESGSYYVDKTGFAHRMITEGRCYFLSRPRRFGKSLFVDMLSELFQGTEDLFEGLFIHDRWDWNTARPVVRFDFSGGFFTEPDGLKASLSDQLGAVESEADLRYEAGFPARAFAPAAEGSAQKVGPSCGGASGRV